MGEWKGQRQKQKARQHHKADAMAPMAALDTPLAGSDLRFDMQIDERSDQARKNVANVFDARRESLRAKEIVYQAKPKNECRGGEHHIGGRSTGWPADQKKEKEKALRSASKIAGHRQSIQEIDAQNDPLASVRMQGMRDILDVTTISEGRLRAKMAFSYGDRSRWRRHTQARRENALLDTPLWDESTVHPFAGVPPYARHIDGTNDDS